MCYNKFSMVTHETPLTQLGELAHTDLGGVEYNTPESRKATAIKNLREAVDNDKLSVTLGLGLASLVADDNRNRIAWNARWRNATGQDSEDASVIKGRDVSVETMALLISHADAARHGGDTRIQDHWNEDAKGMSVELAHTVMLGDWSAGKGIDAELRKLPLVVPTHNMTMSEIYDRKALARIRYKLRLGGMPGEEYVGLTRLRAVADVQTENGDTYDVVKRSSFAFATELLTEEQKVDLAQALGKLAASGTGESMLNAAASHVGETILEPALEDAESTSRDRVYPGSVVYFVLRRLEKHEKQE